MDNLILDTIPRQFSLDEWNEREYEIAEKTEELESQRDMLNSAVEELISKNKSLASTLEELTKRKKELDQLIYRLSHDLKTPITSIIGVCQVMKLEGLPTNFYSHTDHIKKQGLELLNLLKSLSSFSDAVLEEINHQLFKPKEVLREVLSSLSADSVYDKVTFQFSYNGLEEFCSDREKVFLIFQNLIRNAMDFRRVDGESLVKISLEVMNEKLTFICTDNGIGIPNEIQQRIFEMFYRGSEKSKGNGMGLYLVNELLKRLEGNIHLESIQGETSFIITIPYCQKDSGFSQFS